MKRKFYRYWLLRTATALLHLPARLQNGKNTINYTQSRHQAGYITDATEAADDCICIKHRSLLTLDTMDAQCDIGQVYFSLRSSSKKYFKIKG